MFVQMYLLLCYIYFFLVLSVCSLWLFRSQDQDAKVWQRLFLTGPNLNPSIRRKRFDRSFFFWPFLCCMCFMLLLYVFYMLNISMCSYSLVRSIPFLIFLWMINHIFLLQEFSSSVASLIEWWKIDLNILHC